MTESVREALRKGTAALTTAGVPEPELDTEYLLAGLLKTTRLDLRLRKTETLNENTVNVFEALLSRRAAREPLQYILGNQPFMGFLFKTDPRALIPRFDTEAVCEAAVHALRNKHTVLDLCCGSGAIGIAIKLTLPKLSVTLTDISPDALSLTRENAQALHADVEVLQGDLWDAVRGRRFDVIVSNPPYIPLSMRNGLQAEVLREPALALFGGPDGLDFYRRICLSAPEYLAPGGALILETGDDQFEAVSALLPPEFALPELIRDLNGHRRGLITRLRP